MSSYDDLFKDNPEDSSGSQESHDEEFQTREIDVDEKEESWFEKNKKLLSYVGGGLVILGLGAFLYNGIIPSTDHVEKAYKQALDACEGRVEDPSQCKGVVQNMEDEGQIQSSGGDKILFNGQTVICATSGKGCDFKGSLEPFFCNLLPCKDQIEIFSEAPPTLSVAPGGGATREDVRIQSVMFSPAVAAKGITLEGIQDPHKEEVSVFESPNGIRNGKKEDGFIGCCYNASSDEPCSAEGASSEYNNCIVSADSNHLIYCGTIRDTAKTVPSESWSKIRPADVALSFMYYRAAALAESTEKVDINSVWINLTKVVSSRNFSWAIFEEVVTATTWEDFVKFPALDGLEDYEKTAIKKALGHVFKKNGKNKVCFVQSNADFDQLEEEKPSLSAALAMSIFAPYNADEDVLGLHVAPFLKHMYDSFEDRKKWGNTFFHGSKDVVVDRAQEIAKKAFKNPDDGSKLEPPKSFSGEDSIAFLQDTRSASPMKLKEKVSKGSYEVEFKSESPFDGVGIKYEELNSKEQINSTLKRCNNTGKCCVIDVDVAKNAIRNQPEKVDPTVIGLYGGIRKKDCAPPLFGLIMDNNDILKSLRISIEKELGMISSSKITPECPECRRGGLLPKYALNKSKRPPQNKFPQTSPICNSEAIIGFPNDKDFLGEVANTLRDELNNNTSGITFKTRGLSSPDIEAADFDILLTTEIYYTMTDAPSLYRYKLDDRKGVGRQKPPFQGDSDPDKCAQCLFKNYEKFLYGGSPSYIEEDICEDEAFLTKKCKIPEEAFVSHETLLPFLEEAYMRAEQPILHLYYYAPIQLFSDPEVKGVSCEKAVKNLINKK